ncbi:MAG: tetratricopeptide repeat protein [Deltaproteobacteria bacterium]|nr:tetratricopeptide repeat protein [Deltaproteobacteria bacterium]
MTSIFDDRAYAGTLTRRDFIKLAALASVSVAAGCAANPVTGQSQLMLMSEGEEVQIDKVNSPHQFSADYGVSQDKALGAYVAGVGTRLAKVSHRTQMPYNFNVVNATYINAYAFPGGSIAITRGILAELDNEAELAGLIGHELGHVNARHTAARMSKGKLISGLLGGASLIAGAANQTLGNLTGAIGGLGASLLLAKYSREDERQADELGMEYMVKSGHSPQGMVGLMDVLRSMGKSQPSAIEAMFASHPMSTERYETAVHRAQQQYGGQQNLPQNAERYKDSTARLRKLKPMFARFQEGDKAMAAKEYQTAQERYADGLAYSPNDYAGLLMMAKCHIAQKNGQEAANFAARAKTINPNEAQAQQLHGVAAIMLKRYDAALGDFRAYDKRLPGNPSITFMKGFCLENMKSKQAAAEEYHRYLKQVTQGDMAEHAYSRLKAWGYL